MWKADIALLMEYGYAEDYADGNGTEAQFYRLIGVAVDSAGRGK
jgi:hypothetical protein